MSAAHRATGARLPGDARAALRHEYGTLGRLVPRVLAKCPPSSQIHYGRVAQANQPCWSRGRAVLVGDASQAVSLFAGPGDSLAIGGACVLADQLARTSRVEDALHGDERPWRPVIVRRQRAARRAACWFVPESPRDLRVRRAALQLSGLPGPHRLFGVSLTGRQGPPLRRFASSRLG
ncbi:hypothetical protein ACWC2K_06210 [Streptomyces chattanoogensis]